MKLFTFFLIISICLKVFCAQLIIIILSSPENFGRRESLRKTWLKWANSSNIKYYFVLGNAMCPIPEKYLSNKYSCEMIKSSFEAGTHITATTVSKPKCSKHGPSGFGFVVSHQLTITALGIHLKNITSPVQIKLFDASGDGLLASVTVLPDDKPSSKSIRPVLFPKGSEGFITMQFSNDKDRVMCRCSNLIWSYSDVLVFTSLLYDGRLLRFNDGVSPCLYFLYSVADYIHHNETLFSSRKADIDNIYEHIQKENSSFRDLIFVNHLDAYDHLPQKLLKTFKYVDKSNQFEYLLKTDDDSFINLPVITATLKPHINESMWWWSSFKEFWQVPLVGKWRDSQYLSSTYPPFPCGGGYIVSRSVVQYLATVTDNLRLFKGEDVSMGIWMSGMKVQRYTPHSGHGPNSYINAVLERCDPRCEWTCHQSKKISNYMCNKVDLSIEEIHRTWDIINKIHKELT